MEHFLSLYPFTKISILGNFNVYQQLWLSSLFPNNPGKPAFNFAILHDLEQLVEQLSRIPYRLGDLFNFPDIFLASNRSAYSITLSPPLGFSNHNLTSVSYPVSSKPPLDPPKRKCLWCVASSKLGDIGTYYADFSRNDYCFRVRDPFLCAEVRFCGMEAYILPSFS